MKQDRYAHAAWRTLVVALGVCPPAAHAVTISEGWDYILTPPSAETRVAWGTETVFLESLPYRNPLSRTLWGEPAAPIPTFVSFRTEWLDPHGTVVGPDSHHKVKQVIVREEIVLGDFDTVVRRPAPAVTGATGTTADVPIEIEWLSLKSVAPVPVPALPFCATAGCDLYVGFERGLIQDIGMMRLTSGNADGSQGTINLGLTGDAADDGALGLPLNWQAKLLPHGMDPFAALRDGYVFTMLGTPLRFQQPTAFSTYTVAVPEPETWALFLGGLAVLGRFSGKPRRRV